MSLDPAPTSDCRSISSACRDLLVSLVDDCVACIEHSCTNIFECKDWILAALDREDFNDNSSAADKILPLSPDKAATSSKDTEGRPSVLWAYFVLRSLLTHRAPALYSGASTSHRESLPAAAGQSSTPIGSKDPLTARAAGGRTPSSHRVGEPGTGNGGPTLLPSRDDPMDLLVSSGTLSKLLKASLSPNVSLKFCAFDLSALILSRINMQLYRATNGSLFPRSRAGGVASNPLQSPLKASPSSRYQLSPEGKDYRLMDAELDEYYLHECETTQLQLAAEYYVSIAKERKLLQIFSSRIRAESMEAKLFSRYTRYVVLR